MRTEWHWWSIAGWYIAPWEDTPGHMKPTPIPYMAPCSYWLPSKVAAADKIPDDVC